MVFMVTLALLILLALYPLSFYKGSSGIKISGLKRAAGNFLRVSAAALPAVILTLLFLATTKPLEQHPERLGFSLLAEWVAAIRPLLALRYGFPWKSYTYMLFMVFLAMTIMAVVRKYHSYRQKREVASEQPVPFRLTSPILFFLFTLGSLALLFILPNTILLSERLILLFYLFLISALALLHYPRWIHYALAMTVIILHISFTRMYTYTLGDYSEKAEKTAAIVHNVEQGAMVLPLNYNEKWIFMHISGYAGVNRPLAILENYEAGLSWFPVRWNRDYYATGFLDRSDASNTLQLCENFLHPELPGYFSLMRNNGTPEVIPYILVIHPSNGEPPGIPSCARKILDASYKVVRENDFCRLYKAGK
jgi:hypothetical protein